MPQSLIFETFLIRTLISSPQKSTISRFVSFPIEEATQVSLWARDPAGPAPQVRGTAPASVLIREDSGTRAFYLVLLCVTVYAAGRENTVHLQPHLTLLFIYIFPPKQGFGWEGMRCCLNIRGRASVVWKPTVNDGECPPFLLWSPYHSWKLDASLSAFMRWGSLRISLEGARSIFSILLCVLLGGPLAKFPNYSQRREQSSES